MTRLVKHLPPTSEVGGPKPAHYVGKMVIFTDGWQCIVQNFDQLYALVSCACKTSRHDMAYSYSVESDVKTLINELEEVMNVQNLNFIKVLKLVISLQYDTLTTLKKKYCWF